MSKWSVKRRFGGKKHSITRKITCIIIGIVTGTVFLCWFLNTTLLEGYYVNSKQDNLKEAFYAVNEAAWEGTLYSIDGNIELEKIGDKYNITIAVMNPESRLVYIQGGSNADVVQQFWDILFATGNDDTEIISREGSYSIGKYQDSRLNTDYLILWGSLVDGNQIFLRIPLENIRESVDVASRFFAYLGVAVVGLSAVISYVITRKITNPILQLADLSRRMTNLEFDAKFQSQGKDEIDFLGEHMNELSATLERTISDLKSANNELLIDIEKKNQIDDMRKEFLSNVSHELKTPLALIQGYAEGLKECINEDQQSREFYCDVIMDEADKMNRMVKQLLTLNQLEFGNEVVAMERFDLTELIQGVIQSTAILREQDGIALTFQDPGQICVWADEFKTEEVLTNFLSNAIHYAEGEKKIIISVTPREDAVRVSVFNTGPRIPEEDLLHIWTKFYKVDKARTREYGGSGIGLSIVKAIMDSFHRPCGAINHPNGVEFWFELDSRC